MHQIWNIFRKDCRQFWPEIIASFLTCAGVVWVYPYQWPTWHEMSVPTGHSLLDLGHLQILAVVAAVLVPVSWFVLIARVVHGENLLGQKQFWLTRPYRWQLLLAEKLLFLLTFISLPLLLTHIAMIYRAGFIPSHYGPSLLYNAGQIAGALLFVVAFAATMKSLVQMLLVMLGLVVLVLAAAFFASGGTSSTSLQVPYNDHVTFPFMVAMLLGVLVFQYSQRRLWIARGLLIAGSLLVIFVGSNPFELRVFDHAYGSQPASSLRGRVWQSKVGINATTGGGDHIGLYLPIEVTGIMNDDVLRPDDIAVEITTSDGSKVFGSWQSLFNVQFSAEKPRAVASISLDRKAYEQVQGRQAAIKVSLALTQYASGKSSQVRLYAGRDLVVPDFGLCFYDPYDDFHGATLKCRYVRRDAALTRVTAPLYDQPCERGAEIEPTERLFTDWSEQSPDDIAAFGLTSVWEGDVSLSTTSRFDSDAPQEYLCPDSMATFTPYAVSQRFRYSFTVGNVRLPRATNQMQSD